MQAGEGILTSSSSHHLPPPLAPKAMPRGSPTEGVSDGSRQERGGEGGRASRGWSFSRSALAAAHFGREDDCAGGGA